MNQELWIELYYKFRRAKEEKLFREYDKKKNDQIYETRFCFKTDFIRGKTAKYDLTIGLKLSFNNFLVSFDLYENVRNVSYNRTNNVIILL